MVLFVNMLNEKTNGKDLLIFFGILLFIGFLAGKNILQSTLIILEVFGLSFILVGIVISSIYFFEKK